jgi:uncharacterized membrane protein
MKHLAPNLRCLLAVLTAVLIAHANARAQQVTFTPLGGLPGGIPDSAPQGISADGRVVLCQGISASGPEAFLWTAAGGYQPLGDLPGGAFGSYVGSLSGDGRVVIGASYGTGPSPTGTLRLFRWKQEWGMTLIPDADGATLSVRAPSYDGSVLIGSSNELGSRWSYRWTPQTSWVPLPAPQTGEAIWAMLVGRQSADASVIGGSYDISGAEGTYSKAFRWTEAAGSVPLPIILPSDGSRQGAGCSFVSPDGRVFHGAMRVSGSLQNGRKACRWEADGTITIIPTENSNLQFNAYGSNFDGSIVCGRANGFAAVYDSANGVRNLQHVLTLDYGLELTGWLLLYVGGCTWDARMVCGHGENPDTTGYQAWLVALPLPGDTYADISGDSRVDAKDVLPFTNCMKGPGVTAWGVCRTAADLDGDGDVDLRDYVKRLQVVAVNACGAVPAPPPPGGGMPGNPHALPGGMGDVNLDCSVDGDDAAAFVDCLTGPWAAAGGVSPVEPDRFALSAACARADVNGDDAVDLRDVVMLQRTR